MPGDGTILLIVALTATALRAGAEPRAAVTTVASVGASALGRAVSIRARR